MSLTMKKNHFRILLLVGWFNYGISTKGFKLVYLVLLEQNETIKNLYNIAQLLRWVLQGPFTTWAWNILLLWDYIFRGHHPYCILWIFFSSGCKLPQVFSHNFFLWKKKKKIIMLLLGNVMHGDVFSYNLHWPFVVGGGPSQRARYLAMVHILSPSHPLDHLVWVSTIVHGFWLSWATPHPLLHESDKGHFTTLANTLTTASKNIFDGALFSSFSSAQM